MHLQDLLKLCGIVIIVIGLALRWRPTLVVVLAAFATGLAAGLPLFSSEGFFAGLPLLTKVGQAGIINTLGRAFAENRLMTLFIITLPAIGLAERYGLQRQAAALIARVRVATVGRLQFVYQLFRVLNGAMGIRLNGHPSFVRPLVFPMSIGAMEKSAIGNDPMERGAMESDPIKTNLVETKKTRVDLSIDERAIERVKAANAAAENYGNFYGQNLSPVQAGILLVYGVMQGLGYTVSVWEMVKFTIPVVVASLALSLIQFSWLDHNLKKMAEGHLS